MATGVHRWEYKKQELQVVQVLLCVVVFKTTNHQLSFKEHLKTPPFSLSAFSPDGNESCYKAAIFVPPKKAPDAIELMFHPPANQKDFSTSNKMS